MRNTSIITTIIMLFCIHTYGQISLKVGETAPNINITDYILNPPKNKDLKNKYIVLEFWATWCAPCLAAVPKINALQQKFKTLNDIYFISLTYEEPTRTAGTLKRIPFNTIVATDQTKKTHVDFDVELEGEMTIPMTVLIDKVGIVRWIGDPNQLESVFQSFISDTAITEEKSLNSEMQKSPATPSVSQMAFDLIKDEATVSSYSLLRVNQFEDMSISFDGLQKKGLYVDSNNNLKSIFSKINKISEQQIIMPDELANQKYSLFYKNTVLKSAEERLTDLKKKLFSSIPFVEKIETRSSEIFQLKILDKTKLEMFDTDESHSGNTETHFIFVNSPVKQVLTDLSKHLKVNIKDNGDLPLKYNFIFRIGTLDQFIEDLETYGLNLVKEEVELTFYNYTTTPR